MNKFLNKDDFDFLQQERGEINKRKADGASSRNLQPWFVSRMSDIHASHFGETINMHCSACVGQGFTRIHDLLEKYESEQKRLFELAALDKDYKGVVSAPR